MGSLPCSSVHGILQAKIIEWVVKLSSRESSWPKDWTQVSCIAADSLPLSHRGRPEEGDQFSRSVMSYSATPWIAARQASLSITNSWSPPKPMSIESAMPYSHLILCHHLLLLPSILPSIRVFSNKSTLHMRWPKYWSFRFNIYPCNEQPGLISFRMD